MRTEQLTEVAREILTGRRVFGEPYEKDGVTVIPAVMISGGGGGGASPAEGGDQQGGGFGLRARPAGIYVISDGRVRWRPAVDVNRIVLAAAAVAVTFMVSRARVQRARLRQGHQE